MKAFSRTLCAILPWEKMRVAYSLLSSRNKINVMLKKAHESEGIGNELCWSGWGREKEDIWLTQPFKKETENYLNSSTIFCTIISGFDGIHRHIWPLSKPRPRYFLAINRRAPMDSNCRGVRQRESRLKSHKGQWGIKTKVVFFSHLRSMSTPPRKSN